MRTEAGYFLWNFAMDALLALCAARLFGRERPGPALLAGALGALYALIARRWLGGVGGMTLAAAGMAAIAVRPRTAAELLRAMAALAAASLFAAGAQLLARQWGAAAPAAQAASAAAGAMLFLWTGRARRASLRAWDVQLVLRTQWGTARFRALVDTGNRLHEPISGLPVLIAEERVLRKALPPGFDAAAYARRPPPGFRLASYGVLGAAGRMACFRPRALLVSYGGGWLSAPDVWVAVYPGRIPGQVCALAPTVIGAIRGAGRARRPAGAQNG